MTIPQVREIMRRPGAIESVELCCPDLAAPSVVVVAADASLLEAARVLARQRVECAPVLSDDRLVGWLTTRDLVHALADYARRAVARLQPGQVSPTSHSTR